MTTTPGPFPAHGAAPPRGAGPGPGAPGDPGRRLLARMMAPVAAGVVAAAALGYVGAVSPYQAGHYPVCPSLWLTGWYCPGCGSLRAVHSLVTGDLAGAMAMNPLAVLAAPALVLAWVVWLRRGVTGRDRSWLAPGWVVWGLLTVVLAYWVARNIPALQPWLAP